MFVDYSDRFEDEYIRQGEDENRSIEETLDLGWKLLGILPRAELKRVKDEFIDKYWSSADGLEGDAAGEIDEREATRAGEAAS